VIHPRKIPDAVGELLPNLPASVGATTVEAMRGLRLPH
jgi:hypothetical protein